MIKKHFWKLFALAAVVLIGGAFMYSNHIATEANAGVTVDEPHVKGNPDAAVTLTKYSDFQCPACAQFSTVIDDVLATYEDQIRFEYRHFPLISNHPHAVAAGRAAEAAGQQGKFFEMHDQLFANQAAWSASANPRAFFDRYAEEIGLDMEQFKSNMRASVLRDRVIDGHNEARDLGLTGTPTFFLNGERMTYTTFQDFMALVDAAVNEAGGGAVLPSDTETEEIEVEAEASIDPITEPAQFGF